MNVTLEELVAIIGEKEVAIYLLRKQLAQMEAKLAALEKSTPA